MQIEGKLLVTSATDLATFMGCQHATHLDKKSILGQVEKPFFQNKLLEELKERGIQHEQQYLSHLDEQGIDGIKLDQGSTTDDLIAAMQQRPGYIYQARLEQAGWRGFADFLVLAGKPSNLGDYSYEVLDAKLSRETRGETILQLCVYSEILAELQGAIPDHAHVLTPGEFKPENYRLAEYAAYFRRIKHRFLNAVTDIENVISYPEPCAKCDRCDWSPICDKQWRDDDHLTFVAGINRSQRQTLTTQNIDSLQLLADLEDIEILEIKSVSKAGYTSIRNQAALQRDARDTNALTQSLIPLAPDATPIAGLYLLPEPSPGDVFFDIEGARFVGESGFEYLLGYTWIDDDGDAQYESLLANSLTQEADIFSQFMQEMQRRISIWPDMHIYHFHHYEQTALKRLAGKYAMHQDELDDMLRADRLVDLHSITKHTVQCGVERYSIKDLEPYFGFTRQIELKEAGDARHGLEKWLESYSIDEAQKEQVDIVVGYNKDDCLATRGLRDWLEGFRQNWIDQGQEIPRPIPDPETSEELSERLSKMRELSCQLRNGLSEFLEEVDDVERGQWLLSHLIEFHRREDKSAYWEKFRLGELNDQERLEDKAAVCGLEFIETVDATKTGIPTDRYSFPNQELTIKPGDKLLFNQHDKLVPWGNEVVAVDYEQRTLDLKKTKKTAEIHVQSAFAWSMVKGDPLADAIFSLGEKWLAGENTELARALLGRHLPKFLEFESLAAARDQFDSELDLACTLVYQLDNSILPIQGPPGTGKTFTGAHMILAAFNAGKTVGVVAQSHKVIVNLLKEVAKIARDKGQVVPIIRNAGSKNVALDDEDEMIHIGGNDEVAAGLGNQYAVAGGTAWLWTRAEMAQSVDILFVDEAGQFSLANTVAVSQAANSLVLLGDPQQLDQPMQGTHPPGTGVSGLAHILDEATTMPPERGLFLPITFRMHPEICDYVSETFYSGELSAENARANQKLVHQQFPEGTGLWYLPTEHQHNSNASVEEAEKVKGLVEQLLDGGCWIDYENVERELTLGDILIVTPYNAQMGEITRRIEGARVGTVDKFQGQQAPVVIVSYATSSPADAPRGMDFLYSLNRLNVAVSRARCAVFLTCAPQLLEPECRVPWQMRLANGLASFVEHARVLN